MTYSNALMNKLGISVPIIQAPMAGVSSPEMAAEAARAGALGSIGAGAGDADSARAMIRSVRQKFDGPLNVNLFCHRPATARPEVETAWIARFRQEFAAYSAEPPQGLREIYQSFVVDDAMLAMLLDERPKVVSFHFGLPPDGAIRALKEAGIVLLASATSLDEAQKLVGAGIDAVVAQGWEAGGHRGVFDPDAPDDRLGVVALTRQLVQALDCPVIAAGGLMDGAGIAAAVALGASAAQLGTAFIACDESLADGGYRAALVGQAARHTVMTRAISGRPARCLANRFTARGADILPAEVPDYPIAYDLGKALNAAAKSQGESGFGAQWAGQGAPLSRPMPTARMVETLAREFEAARGAVT